MGQAPMRCRRDTPPGEASRVSDRSPRFEFTGRPGKPRLSARRCPLNAKDSDMAAPPPRAGVWRIAGKYLSNGNARDNGETCGDSERQRCQGYGTGPHAERYEPPCGNLDNAKGNGMKTSTLKGLASPAPSRRRSPCRPPPRPRPATRRSATASLSPARTTALPAPARPAPAPPPSTIRAMPGRSCPRAPA